MTVPIMICLRHHVTIRGADKIREHDQIDTAERHAERAAERLRQAHMDRRLNEPDGTDLIDSEVARFKSITGRSFHERRRRRFVLWRLYRYHGLALAEMSARLGLPQSNLHVEIGRAFKEACEKDDRCFWRPFLKERTQ